MPKKTLNVYADPYGALDHEGRPAHACPTDPTHTPGARRWVGAGLSAETKLVDKLYDDVAKAVAGGLHEHPQDTVFAFETEPVTLPSTPYYRERIRHGELIPADEKTAREAGATALKRWQAMVTKDVDAAAVPKAMLAASRAAAIGRWHAEHEEFPDWADDDDKKAFADAQDKAAAAKAAAPTPAAQPGAPPVAKTTDAPASLARSSSAAKES